MTLWLASLVDFTCSWSRHPIERAVEGFRALVHFGLVRGLNEALELLRIGLALARFFGGCRLRRLFAWHVTAYQSDGR